MPEDPTNPSEEIPERGTGRTVCPQCDGSGESNGEECPTCLGLGTVIERLGGG
jgi:DnaJ-class molecular chaperone